MFLSEFLVRVYTLSAVVVSRIPSFLLQVPREAIALWARKRWRLLFIACKDGLTGALVRGLSRRKGVKTDLSPPKLLMPRLSPLRRAVSMKSCYPHLPIFLPPPIIYSKINGNNREREWRRENEKRDNLY